MNVAVIPETGGTASATPHEVTIEDPHGGEFRRWYEFLAIPAAGCTFSHWSWTAHTWTEYESAPGVRHNDLYENCTASTNPYGDEDGPIEAKSWYGPAYGMFGFVEILNLTAHFNVSSITVITRAEPKRAAVTEGGGTYLHGETVQISTHHKCSPWIFDHWTINPGNIVVNTADHQFSATDNVTCEATYRHTSSGLPYRDNRTGKIIMKDDGSIFYDGDQVNSET